MIRKARLKDSREMSLLIKQYANQGKMLPRSQTKISYNIRDYFVAELDKKVIGCISLHLYSEDLSEIKALAVAPVYQRQGWGGRLIEKCLQEAAELGMTRIFALTYVPVVFEKLGFSRADKNELPEKIWQECIECPKYDQCDEICVIKEINEAL